MTRSWTGARRIEVAADPGAVTAIDARSEAGPGAGGLTPAAVESIWSSVAALYRTGVYPALTFCLRRRGEIVLNRSLGYARGGGPGEWPDAAARLAQPDTPICLFSASKAITAILIHKLAEEGGVDLDAPVARYVPAFAAGGKAHTTISQVLAHRGGFPVFAMDAVEAGPETLLDWDRCIDLICRAPAARGGHKQAYHAITGGFIVAEIIRRVTGMAFTDYHDTRLRRPLGMRYFSYGLDGRSRGRVARNYLAGQPVRFPVSVVARRALSAGFDDVVDISNRDYFMDAVIPAGNLYATAEETSRFYQMLLDDGVYAGRPVLAPDTVARALRPVGRIRFDRTLMVPMRYSEGMMLGSDPFGLYGPMSARAYGHLGFMNILGWADPTREVAAGLLVTGKAILGGHLGALARTLSCIGWHCR